MTPDDLETHLGDHPASSTVEAIITGLRADPDWSVTELALEGQPQVIEILHRPTSTGYTLRRRPGSTLQKAEGG